MGRAENLTQMVSMGFNDIDANNIALTKANEDVNRAIEFLLGCARRLDAHAQSVHPCPGGRRHSESTGAQPGTLAVITEVNSGDREDPVGAAKRRHAGNSAAASPVSSASNRPYNEEVRVYVCVCLCVTRVICLRASRSPS